MKYWILSHITLPNLEYLCILGLHSALYNEFIDDCNGMYYNGWNNELITKVSKEISHVVWLYL